MSNLSENHKRIPLDPNCCLYCSGIPYIYIDNIAYAIDEKGFVNYALTAVLRNMLKIEKAIDNS